MQDTIDFDNILHDYQKYARDFIIDRACSGLFLDVGLGKTLITLSALYKLNPPCPVLIIAPKNVARTTWFDEINDWNLPIRIKSLINNDKGKKLTKQKRYEKYEEVLTNPPAIYMINRDLVCDVVEYYRNKKMKFPFEIVVIDEFQAFKNYRSKRFKALKKVRPEIKKIIGLTGTPVPNGLKDLWALVYLLDMGARLGTNFTWYRETFFNTTYLPASHTIINMQPKEGAKKEIYRRIQDIVISVKNHGIKLPPLTITNDYCTLTDKEQAIYDELEHNAILEFENTQEELNTVTAANQAVLLNKLIQLSSGTIYVNQTKEYEIIHKQKINKLLDIIENTNSPVAVAYIYNSEKELLLKELQKAKINVELFDGSPEMTKKWNERKIDVMLLQPQSAGAGINIQHGGSTLVWYTLTWNLENYLQTNGRFYRQGQKDPVIIHHIVTKHTNDMKVLKKLKNKEMTQNELLQSIMAKYQKEKQ